MNIIIERRIRKASGLLMTGLGIQLATLFWNHPLTFLAFIFIGSPLVLTGVAMYLTSLLRASRK